MAPKSFRFWFQSQYYGNYFFLPSPNSMEWIPILVMAQGGSGFAPV